MLFGWYLVVLCVVVVIRGVLFEWCVMLLVVCRLLFDVCLLLLFIACVLDLCRCSSLDALFVLCGCCYLLVWFVGAV